jgi:hypothetical protein
VRAGVAVRLPGALFAALRAGKKLAGPVPPSVTRMLITCGTCEHGRTPHSRHEHALAELRRDLPALFPRRPPP